MTVTTYRRLIVEGLQGLPTESLAEIADFVLFVRRRALQPEVVEAEFQSALLNLEVRQNSRAEVAHLEEEFADYERRFPRE